MILVSLCITAQAATTYNNLETAFKTADEPLEQNVLGYWAGNCAPRSEPTTYWPAVLLVKEIPDRSGTYTSLSYYWERTPDRDYFRKMAPKDIQADKALNDWFDKEQWTKIHSCHGSLVNRYETSSTQHIRRELRTLGDEFHTRLLLRAIRVDGIKEGNFVYCEFDKPLGNFKAPPPSAADPFSMAGTGLIQNRRVILRNAEPTKTVERFEIINEGTSAIVLHNIGVVSSTGTYISAAVRVPLAAGAGYTFRRQPTTPTLIKEIQFTVSGRSENIEVVGFSTP